MIRFFIVCCVPVQILCLENILFLIYRPKSLSQSDCRIFKSNISPEKIDETVSFLACWYKFTIIKSWLKVFWLSIVKSWYDQSGFWTLKLTVVKRWYGQSGFWILKLTASQEWSDGINWFFACWYKFIQVKRWLKMFEVGLVRNRCGQSCDRTIKFTVSEEWADGINWFFACWYRFTKIKRWSKIYWVGMPKMGVASLVTGLWNWLYLNISKMNRWNKFRRAKSRFNNFWVDIVKNGNGLLVHETLKSVVS